LAPIVEVVVLRVSRPFAVRLEADRLLATKLLTLRLEPDILAAAIFDALIFPPTIRVLVVNRLTEEIVFTLA